jgi:hypothetical protein
MALNVKDVFLGKPKSPLDPHVFERLSLVAFLAWVGLGADGLSSACYGPEATFRALGEHRHLAPFLALATVLTVSILSAAYAYTIEAFPSGGGGYVVATRALGKAPGVLCGCALIVDYVLTVAISIAAGADAVFSLLPAASQDYKVVAAAVGVVLLMLLNFRGVKESVIVLVPIFIVFLVTHAVMITLSFFVSPAASSAAPAAASTSPVMPVAAAAVLLLRAYSHGAGTYTGIEAVSNSLTILREPRVKTARRAMLYMAVSLSLVAGGLLLGYLHMDIRPTGGKTFNAVLAQAVFGEGTLGRLLVLATLLSEALLLVVAAQAGFIDGPRVLASMAVDSWVPRWFSRLSDRLVVSNGILLIGLGGLVAISATMGHVDKLVVIYSFSVFVTFLLSQLGMTRYWAQHRDAGWRRRLLVSVLAAALSLAVLVSLLFAHGFGLAGLSLASIVALSIVCFLVKHHYSTVAQRLKRLHTLPDAAEADPYRRDLQPRDKDAPTAVFLVNGYGGTGLHTLLGIQRLFPNYFRQMVFLSVGVVDFDRFKGEREIENLKSRVNADLEKYVTLVARWGFPAEVRSGFGVDVAEELENLCARTATDYPRSVFFCGDLVFQLPTSVTKMLHDQTAEDLQRRLHLRGLPLLVIPIRV